MSPLFLVLSVSLVSLVRARALTSDETGNMHDVALARACMGLDISRRVVEDIVEEISHLDNVNMYELFATNAVPYIGQGIANYLNHQANGPSNNKQLSWFRTLLLRSDFDKHFWSLIESSCNEFIPPLVNIVKRVESKQEIVESLNPQSKRLITGMKFCVNVLSNPDKVKEAAYKKARHYKILSL